MAESRGAQLFLDPDQHPDDTLKSFNELLQDFALRYDANFPDPPKVSMDTALERWKLGNPDKKPSLDEYDSIREEWQSRDKVAKFLGIYSSRRLFNDWKAAETVEKNRKNAYWDSFVSKLQDYDKPTQNLTLKNFQFRTLVQEKNETFTSFCNKVAREAKHCQFKCDGENCTAEEIAVRDQIIIGIISDEIRGEALKKSWNLASLRKEGMTMESAAKGAAEIAGDGTLNKLLGKYSYRNIKGKEGNKKLSQKKVNCFYCGISLYRNGITAHAAQCPAKSSKCTN